MTTAGPGSAWRLLRARHFSVGKTYVHRGRRVAPLPDYWHVLSHPAEYRFYGFVRNPYARLKSAWEDKLAYGHETGYQRSIRGRRLHAIRRLCREHDLAGRVLRLYRGDFEAFDYDPDGWLGQ